MSDPQAVEPGSPGRFDVMSIAPTLVFDVALPIVLFNVLSSHGVSTLWALVVAGLAPGLNNMRVWLTSRRIEPLGVIVIAFLIVGTAASLMSGNVFFVLVKDSFLTATFGLICFASLLAERPLLFVILRQFVAGEDAERIAWWNGLYGNAEFRKAIRFVTVVWGAAYIAEATVRVGLALTLRPSQVVAISPVMGFGLLIALIFWTRRYMQALRERRLSERQASV